MGSPRLEDTLGAKPLRLTDELAVDTSILTTVVAEEVVRIHGASSLRVRFKATKAGVLYVAILQHDQTTEQVDPPPRSVPVLDATEVMIEFDNIVGESYALIKFTVGGATSVITYCDLYRSFNPQTKGTSGGVEDDFVVPGGSGNYAPEVIYLNRDHRTAGVAAPSDMAYVSEVQIVVEAIPATASFVVDLLKPGGDPTAAGDWLLDQYTYTSTGANAPIPFSRWHGVRVRAKSGGTGGTATASVRWWN